MSAVLAPIGKQSYYLRLDIWQGAENLFSVVYVDVVDNQYIAVSVLWMLTTPVPWDATCEDIAACATPCDMCETFKQITLVSPTTSSEPSIQQRSRFPSVLLCIIIIIIMYHYVDYYM
jgi:hypothetical protein